MPKPKTVLYVRVSTAEQTSAHQVEQARAEGFDVEDRFVIVDHGVSGVSTKLAERDQGKRLFDLLNDGDTLLVRWVDRLGRDYRDVSDTMRLFLLRGVTIKTVINRMTFDATLTDPLQLAARDAMLAFMAALADADAKAKKEARTAGTGRNQIVCFQAVRQILLLAQSNTTQWRGSVESCPINGRLGKVR